jgi:GT2 family glycosyltransferase
MSQKHAILMVNYKTLALTSRCLDLIKQNLDLNQYEVWVVDNHSNDQSTDYLRSLDWIHLLERSTDQVEKGFESHGKALDFALEKISNRYVFLLHTDTFIYDASVLDRMLQTMQQKDRVVAVGCYEQVLRSPWATAWRRLIRFLKHYKRVLLQALGISTRPPRGFYERYIKSFCALWDMQTVKQHGFTLYMAEKIPTYELQDRMRDLGFHIIGIKPRVIFQYLDHVEAGTVSLKENLPSHHRRVKRKQKFLSAEVSK